MERQHDLLAPGAVARAVLIALGLFALADFLWAGRDLLFIVFFGVLVALFLSIFVDRMVDLGLPRVASTLLVVLVLAGLTAGFFIGLWPTVREQLSVVASDVPETMDTIGTWVEEQYREVMGSIPGDQGEAAPLDERLWGRVGGDLGSIVGGALPVLNTMLGALGGVLIVLMTGIFIAADPKLYRHGLERLLPPRHRQRVGDALGRTAHALRGWMLGTVINMAIVAALTGIGLWLLDVPAVIALALIAGIMEFIPFFGPILSAIPAMAVALTVSPLTALWVALLFTGVQQLQGNVVSPLVMRGAAQLPPALTLLFQSLMAIVFGFLGLLLAVPILAAGLVMVRTLYVEPLEEKEDSPR